MSNWYDDALKNAKKIDKSYSDAVKKDLQTKAKEQKAKKEAEQKAKQDKLKKAKGKTITTPNGHKVNAGGRRQLTPEVKLELERQQATNAVPKFLRNMTEAVIDNSVLGGVTTLAYGKKPSSDFDSPYYDEIHSGTSATLGRLAGQGAMFASQFAAGSAPLDKVSQAVAKTKLGQAVAKSVIGDATIGLGQNIVMAKGEGLEGKDLAKDVVINTGLDLALGAGLEVAPAVKNALKNTKLAKQAKNVGQVVDTTKKVAETGDLGAKNTLPDPHKFNKKTNADIQNDRLNELADQIKKADAEAKPSDRITQTNKRVKTNTANRTARANAKSQELLDEYIKIQNMTPDEYVKYAKGEISKVDTGSQVKMDTSAVKATDNTPRSDDLTPEAKQKLYRNIEKRSGVKIVEEELPDNIEGFFEGGTIHVNKNSASTGFTVLKHELTHHIESSKDYKAFSDFVVKGMKENGFDVNAIKDEIKDFYDGNLGKQLTDDEALKEVVANFSGEYLFNSEKSIERLSRENPGLFRRIYDWIVDTINKFGKDDSTKFLIDAQRKYEKALRTVGASTDIGKKYAARFDEKIQLGNKSEYGDTSKINHSSDGNVLSKTQIDFFKDSVVRNSKGELIPLYHTTVNGGWTQPRTGSYLDNATGELYDSGSSRGLFMSSDKEMSLSYAESSPKDVIEYNKKNLSGKSKSGEKGIYKFYVDFKSPYILDAKGAMWNEISVNFENVTRNSNITLRYDEKNDKYLLSIFDKADKGKRIDISGSTYDEIMDEIEKHFSPIEWDDFMGGLGNVDDYTELYDVLDELTYDEGFANARDYFGNGEVYSGELGFNWNTKKVLPTDIANTEQIVLWAREQERYGQPLYDSVIIKNVQDYAKNDGFYIDDARDIFIAFEPDQVKLVDNIDPSHSSDVRYMSGNGLKGRNEPLYFTSKNLYGETGNKYINEGKNLPKGKTKADKTLPTKAERTVKANKLKSVSADAKNPNYEMTYEQASKMYDNYKNGTPVKLPGKGDVSKAADTVIGSDYISDEMRTALKDNVSNYVKTTKSNKVTLDNVNARIDEKGLTPTLKAFQKLIPEGKKITEEDIATGAELIRRLDEKGKYEEALDVADDLIEMMSQAGRTLQAANIFASMTPYGKIRSVRKAAENMSNRYGKKVAVDETLLKKLFEETDPAKADKIKQSIFLDLWNQVPPTLMEKLDAIRYTAMLSSPKTHLRNIFGNTAMYVGKELSDAVETALEKSLFKGKMEKVGALRNKTVLNPLSAEDMALKKKAGELFEDIKNTILNHDVKYIEKGNMRPQDSPVFKGKALESARKFVSGTLEYEDEIFMKINFQNAFAKICKANGLEVGELTPREIRQFTAYATQQAQTATFRDANALASAMNRVYKYANDTAKSDMAGKIGKGMLKTAMDATVPFKKTPANVLKQGWRYSPGGLIEGMARCISAKDADSLMKGIEILSNGIVGTPILLAGAYMAKEGLVNGSIGNYSDKDTKYKKMLGQQDYSIIVGDKTITMDWLSPYSMPFFVGVELGSALEDKEFTGTELVDAMASITNPFLEMSMLQGLQSLITANYEENAAQTLIQNTLKSYVAQFIPSISQQFARTIAKTTTTTSRVNDGTSSGKFIKSTAAQLKSKVPGLYSMNEPDVDMWGRTDTKEDIWDYVNAGLRNIVSPSNIKDMNVTTVDKEILRLYDNLDDEQNAVIPTPASSKVEYKGNEYRMTDKEFTQYKKDLGQYRYKELEKLFKTTEYKSANIEGKADMVKAVYKKANDVAKKNFLIKSGKMTKEEYAMSTIESKGAIKAINSGKTTAVKVTSAKEELEASSAGKKGILQAYALIGKYDADTIKAVGGMNSSGGYKISDNTINEARNLKNSGVGLSEIQQIYVKANADGNGAVSKAEAMAYLNKSNYSREQRRAIFDALMSNPNTKNPY